MKLKNKGMLMLVLLVFTAFSFAQQQLSASEQKSFTEKVKISAEETRSIISDFVQDKHISVLSDVVKSEGKMVLLMPDKIRWEYLTPTSNIAIFSGNKLYVNDDGKKNEFDLDGNKIFKSFNSLIINSIKGDMFDENQFEITYFDKSENYMVRFIPKEKRLKKLISAFELKFDKVSAVVEEVKLIESANDFTTIRFLNRKTNVEVKPSEFQQ
ncbi:Outer membrane lipoprotein-sorting protein [Flavobacteriaceae bacterium MAR_2010_188]|nr:Outer membrane lipoprotein-sorting protein [Flavobacteriaceae bacterium MAR_2010_188]